jgi:hypothetical protein
MLKIGIKGVTVRQFRVNESRRDMRLYFFYRSSATVLALISYASHSAMAQTLTPFRYESQAQRHCPGDTIVWLDFGRARYYLKGQRRYASGYTGSFVCRNEARDSGYRRSPLGLR